MDPGVFLAIASLPLLVRAGSLGLYYVLAEGVHFVVRATAVLALVVVLQTALRDDSRFATTVLDIGIWMTWIVVAVSAIRVVAAVRMRGALAWVPRGMVSFAVSLGIPLLLFGDRNPVLIGVLGFELSLSSYSYLAESSRAGPPCFRDTLFFLLVSPLVVYARPTPTAESLRSRVLHGLGRLIAGVFILSGAASLRLALEDSAPAGGLATVCAFVLIEYAAHSARASQDIGFLRIAGFAMPERYIYPLFAASPQQFWSRWNTYVGHWARRYMFLPSLRSLRHLRWGARLCTAVAVLATFLGVGLVHEVGALWRPSMRPLGFTLWFLANACLLVAWRWVEGRAIFPSLGESARPWLRHALVATAIIAMAYLATLLL